MKFTETNAYIVEHKLLSEIRKTEFETDEKARLAGVYMASREVNDA